MNTATLKLAIEVDDKGSYKIRDLGQAAEETGKKGEKGIAGFREQVNKLKGDTDLTIGSLAGIAAIGFGTAIVGLAALTAKMVNALGVSSDLNEAQGKFDVVFAGQRGQAEAWAAELVEAYGMSRREAKATMSGIQDLLVPMGMMPAAAGDMSVGIAKLSADLGSFNNQPTAQVVGDIQSALVGSYEPMMKYGAVLTAATVEAKAMEMGLVKTKDELNASSKAQAAYQLIVEASSAAIGDMARTGDGYANQLKSFHAITEDLTATMGKRLLPVAADVLGKINSGMRDGEGGVENLATMISVKLLQALGMAVETMRFFHNGWDGIKLVGTLAIDAIAQSIEFLYVGLRQILVPLDMAFDGLVQLGAIEVNPFDGVEKALGTFAASSRDVTNQVLADIEKTNASYDTIKSTIDGYVTSVKKSAQEEALAGKKIQDVHIQTGDVITKTAERSTKAQEKATLALEKSIAATQRQIWAMNGLSDAADTVEDSWSKLITLNKDYEKTVAGVDDALHEFFDDIELESGNATSKMTDNWTEFTDGAEYAFTSILGDSVRGEIRSWDDLFDTTTDRLYSMFSGMLAKMVAAWFASGIAGLFSGDGFGGFTIGALTGSGGSGGSVGGSVVNAAGSAVVDYAAKEYLGTSVSDYVMTEAVTPIVESITGYFAGPSTTMTPATLDAYVAAQAAAEAAAAQTASIAAASSTATGTGTTGTMTPALMEATANSSGAGAGAGISAGSVGAGIGAYAVMLMFGSMMGWWGGAGGTNAQLNSSGLNPQDLEGAGVGSTFSNIGQTPGLKDSIAEIDTFYGNLQDYTEVSVDAANGVVVLSSASSDLSARNENMMHTMQYSMQVYDDASGAWTDQSDLFNMMVGEMTRLGPATDDAIAGTAAYLSEMYGVPTVADELVSAFVGLQNNFADMGSAAISASNNVRSAISGIYQSGGERQRDEENLASGPGEIQAHSTGGVVSKLAVPQGDDGLAFLKLGEGVIDADTMKILSASIRNGDFPSNQKSAEVSNRADSSKLDSEEIGALLWNIATYTRKAAAILERFEYTGIPQSTREAVA